MEPVPHLQAPRLQSERLTLEPLRAEDADELAPVLCDDALYQFIGGAPADRAELRSRFERWASGRSPDGRDRWLNWVVRERGSEAAVGTVQATVRDGEEPPAAEVAWVIGTAHQGHGLATVAAGLLAGWLRGEGIQRLRAHIHPDHEASMAVARSIGLAPTEVVVDGELRWESP